MPVCHRRVGDQCWAYGSIIPHGDRLYGAVDVFTISVRRNENCSLTIQRLFYAVEKLET